MNMKKIGYKAAIACGMAAIVIGSSLNTAAVSAKEWTEAEGSMYGIGSVSKTITAIAVMQLAEEGKINLEEPIVTYMLDFKMKDARYKKITARMLLNHSSGLLGMTAHNAMLAGDNTTENHDTFLEMLSNQELKSEPGFFCVYSNDSFTLAEILVERVSGLTFTKYLEEHIFGPLGMKDTKTPQSEFEESKLQKVYFSDSKYVLPTETFNAIGSGGMYSTTEDMMQIARVLSGLEEEVLTKESVEQMLQIQTKEGMLGNIAGDSYYRYGLGLDGVDMYPFNRYGIKAVTKGGDTNGYSAGLTVLPEQKMGAMVVATGGTSTLCTALAQEILLEALREEDLIEKEDLHTANTYRIEKKENCLIPEELKKWEGIYYGDLLSSVAFTDRGTLKISTIDADIPVTQEYAYGEDGCFYSYDDSYISLATGLAQTANGSSGNSKIQFMEDINGEAYLNVSTYELLQGLAKGAATFPFAVKINPKEAENKELKAWEERNGKHYYLIGENYSSLNYITDSYMKLELVKEVPGYVQFGTLRGEKDERIIDADTSKSNKELPLMLGRDAKKTAFTKEDGIEYLWSNEIKYMSEAGIKELGTIDGTCSIEASGDAKWFQNKENSADTMEYKITVPSSGAYYVYNPENECIYSSVFTNANDTVVIPCNGKIVLAGSPFDTFTIERVTVK